MSTIPQEVLKEAEATGKIPVKIIIDRPPVWDAVCQMINGIPRSAIFAWGDTIYNPEGAVLPDFLIEHEMVHMRQQKLVGGPEKWWDRYINDPYFRIDQEAEAYAKQYECMCETYIDRNQRHSILRTLAFTLAGPLYGSIISPSKAMKLIRDARPK